MNIWRKYGHRFTSSGAFRILSRGQIISLLPIFLFSLQSSLAPLSHSFHTSALFFSFLGLSLPFLSFTSSLPRGPGSRAPVDGGPSHITVGIFINLYATWCILAHFVTTYECVVSSFVWICIFLPALNAEWQTTFLNMLLFTSRQTAVHTKHTPAELCWHAVQ